LFFSDIQMPDTMDGVGLARWLRQSHPAIPILLASGRSMNVDPFAGADALIPKQYAPSYVADLIRGILDRRGRTGHARAPDPR
jgi:CheY-like chemotaxis protein